MKINLTHSQLFAIFFRAQLAYKNDFEKFGLDIDKYRENLCSDLIDKLNASPEMFFTLAEK